MRHTLIGFLLSAMISGLRAEASYVCLEADPHLQACNFDRMQVAPTRRDLEKKTKITRGAVMESLYQAPDGTVVIYKLEGCMPARLPFVLPNCKSEDTIDHVVEVRRLFPFTVTGDDSLTAPLIFPEVEVAQLYKSQSYHPIINSQDVKAERDSQTKLSRRRKKVIIESLLKKNRKHEKTLGFEAMDKSEISSIIFPVFENDGSRREAYKSKHHRRRNDIDDSEELKKVSRSGRDYFEATMPEYEFPYARAIPYDPEKIRMLLHLPKEPLSIEEFTRHGSEFPYSRAIPFDPEKHKNLLHETEERSHHRHTFEVPKYFPYEKAIPYDPVKLEQLLMWVKSQDDLSDLKLRKREAIKIGSEFPYNKALPYNHWKVSEFRRRLESQSRPVIRKRSTGRTRE